MQLVERFDRQEAEQRERDRAVRQGALPRDH